MPGIPANQRFRLSPRCAALLSGLVLSSQPAPVTPECDADPPAKSKPVVLVAARNACTAKQRCNSCTRAGTKPSAFQQATGVTVEVG